MTKNIILTTWLLFFLLNVQGQNIISSCVYDGATKEPMPFVNIGIKNKNIGTISNSKGNFSINIPKDKIGDSITFSFVGYRSQTISIKNLIENKSDSILLHQKTQELAEVVIKANGKWKSKKLGLTRNLPGVFGIVQSDTTSDIVECAQQFDLGEELTKISKFHIYLKGVNTDTASFRINFYYFDGNTPTERAFEKEIFIRKKVSNGWLEVDLDEYGVWLKGKTVASIEFLPTESQKEIISLSYGGILVCKGTSYNRTSSQGEWYKLDFGTYSIYLTTKKYETKK
jgi:hypothetical protein